MTTTPTTSHPPTAPHGLPGGRRRRRTTAAALGVAAIVALGACSFSGGIDGDEAAGAEAKSEQDAPRTTEASEAPTTEAPAEDPDPTTTTSTTQVESDPLPEDIDAAELDDAQDRVDRINLTLEDLPAGWVSEPAIDEVGSVVADCTTSGVDDNVVARDRSDRFSLVVGTGGLGLDTASGYLVSEDVAVDLMAELASSEFAACATEQLVSADGVTVVGELAPVADAPALADEVTLLQGDFSLSDDTGATAQLSALVVAIRTDQVVTTVSATAVDTPGDDQLLTEVLELVAERQEL